MSSCKRIQHGSSRRLSAALFSGSQGIAAIFLPGIWTVHFYGNEETINLLSRMAAEREENMAFFTSAITILQTLVVALGAGLAVWGVINLLEGYGNDNPGANAHVR